MSPVEQFYYSVTSPTRGLSQCHLQLSLTNCRFLISFERPAKWRACVCVRACVRVCVRVWVRVWVFCCCSLQSFFFFFVGGGGVVFAYLFSFIYFVVVYSFLPLCVRLFVKNCHGRYLWFMLIAQFSPAHNGWLGVKHQVTYLLARMVSQWLRGMITTTHKHPRQVHHSEGSQTENLHIHWERLLFQCRRKTLVLMLLPFVFCFVLFLSSLVFT